MWLPSVHIWIKYNTDCVVNGSLSPASYGGIFRDYQANFGCFVSNIDILYALNAEIMAVILSIEFFFFFFLITWIWFQAYQLGFYAI